MKVASSLSIVFTTYLSDWSSNSHASQADLRSNNSNISFLQTYTHVCTCTCTQLILILTQNKLCIPVHYNKISTNLSSLNCTQTCSVDIGRISDNKYKYMYILLNTSTCIHY